MERRSFKIFADNQFPFKREELVTIAILLIPIIFNKYWPQKALHWLTIYWYATACFCLPFFFTFMLHTSIVDLNGSRLGTLEKTSGLRVMRREGLCHMMDGRMVQT